jgi:hypothetical protein
MPSSRLDPIDRPHTLLPTNQVSDFSRNFAQLEKHSKRPYSLRKVIRELSDKPARLTGFELEVSQELQSLNPARQNAGTLVPIEAFGIQRRDLTVGTISGLFRPCKPPSRQMSQFHFCGLNLSVAAADARCSTG